MLMGRNTRVHFFCFFFLFLLAEVCHHKKESQNNVYQLHFPLIFFLLMADATIIIFLQFPSPPIFCSHRISGVLYIITNKHTKNEKENIPKRNYCFY